MHAPLRHLSDLPGPRPWPLLGNLPQLSPTRMHRQVEAWAMQYGPLFAMRFATTPVLVVADPILVGGVLRDRPQGFRRPSATAQVAMEMDGRPGLIVAEGAAWRAQRRMVMAALAPHAVKAYFPALVATSLRLRERWRQAAQACTGIALAVDLKCYSIDIIAGLAFGIEVNTLEHGEHVLQRHMDIILAGVARRSMAPFPYWRYLRLARERELDASVAALRTAVDQLITDAHTLLEAEPARRQHPANLLQAMLCAAQEEGSGIDDNIVAGNVATMLLAGEDTTSGTLAWLLYLLHRNPAALRQAREEVLRLKPATPFIPLEALRDSVVGDVAVPKGGLVWCVMRHDNAIPPGSEFDPGRCLHQGSEAIGKQAAMPFGAGPRTCPGRYLALLEIKVACAMLLATFDIAAIDTADGREPEEVMGFTMSPQALQMRLRTRT